MRTTVPGFRPSSPGNVTVNATAAVGGFQRRLGSFLLAAILMVLIWLIRPEYHSIGNVETERKKRERKRKSLARASDNEYVGNAALSSSMQVRNNWCAGAIFINFYLSVGSWVSTHQHQQKDRDNENFNRRNNQASRRFCWRPWRPSITDFYLFFFSSFSPLLFIIFISIFFFHLPFFFVSRDYFLLLLLLLLSLLLLQPRLFPAIDYYHHYRYFSIFFCFIYLLSSYSSSFFLLSYFFCGYIPTPPQPSSSLPLCWILVETDRWAGDRCRRRMAPPSPRPLRFAWRH